MNTVLALAAQAVRDGKWDVAQGLLRAALTVAGPRQRGHILTALKACKQALGGSYVS